jgi:hypothetical protein
MTLTATEQDKGEKQIPPATAGRHPRSPKADDRVRDDNLGAHPGRLTRGRRNWNGPEVEKSAE